MTEDECGGILQGNNQYFVRKQRNCFTYNNESTNKRYIAYTSYVRPRNCTERNIRICIEIKIAAKPHAGGDIIKYKISNFNSAPVDCPPKPILSEGTIPGEYGGSNKRCVQLKLQDDPFVEIRATGSDGVSTQWSQFN